MLSQRAGDQQLLPDGVQEKARSEKTSAHALDYRNSKKGLT